MRSHGLQPVDEIIGILGALARIKHFNINAQLIRAKARYSSYLSHGLNCYGSQETVANQN